MSQTWTIEHPAGVIPDSCYKISMPSMPCSIFQTIPDWCFIPTVPAYWHDLTTPIPSANQPWQRNIINHGNGRSTIDRCCSYKTVHVQGIAGCHLWLPEGRHEVCLKIVFSVQYESTPNPMVENLPSPIELAIIWRCGALSSDKPKFIQASYRL